MKTLAQQFQQDTEKRLKEISDNPYESIFMAEMRQQREDGKFDAAFEGVRTPAIDAAFTRLVKEGFRFEDLNLDGNDVYHVRITWMSPHDPEEEG